MILKKDYLFIILFAFYLKVMQFIIVLINYKQQNNQFLENFVKKR